MLLTGLALPFNHQFTSLFLYPGRQDIACFTIGKLKFVINRKFSVFKKQTTLIISNTALWQVLYYRAVNFWEGVLKRM